MLFNNNADFPAVRISVTGDVETILLDRSVLLQAIYTAIGCRYVEVVRKLLLHPVVGDLDLPFESLPLTAGSSWSMVAYTPEPGSATHDALALLASWEETIDDPGSQVDHTGTPQTTTTREDLQRTDMAVQ